MVIPKHKDVSEVEHIARETSSTLEGINVYVYKTTTDPRYVIYTDYDCAPFKSWDLVMTFRDGIKDTNIYV